VLIVSCPARDCWNREGAKWLEQRLFHEREAELKERVDRRRVRLVELSAGESARLHSEVAEFRMTISRLQQESRTDEIDIIAECKALAEKGAS
jgi:coenzyme F420-reducing hydrogenase delta subunit